LKEEDKKTFLDDFEKADVDKKLDMWYFALDQGALWEELIEEMSKYATIQALKKGTGGSSNE
jgi:hypothetical protein